MACMPLATPKKQKEKKTHPIQYIKIDIVYIYTYIAQPISIQSGVSFGNECMNIICGCVYGEQSKQASGQKKLFGFLKIYHFFCIVFFLFFFLHTKIDFHAFNS